MLDPAIRELAKGKNFAAITTMTSAGRPMTHLIWVDADDDHLLFNTEVERAKFKAVEHDPRVSVVIWDASNPYRYAEVRGRVVATDSGPKARAHIDELAQKYTGGPYANPIGSDRVILEVEPDRQRLQG